MENVKNELLELCQKIDNTYKNIRKEQINKWIILVSFDYIRKFSTRKLWFNLSRFVKSEFILGG